VLPTVQVEGDGLERLASPARIGQFAPLPQPAKGDRLRQGITGVRVPWQPGAQLLQPRLFAPGQPQRQGAPRIWFRP
jgi:hypothetical protein